MKITTKLWIGIVILVLLSPLGVISPGHFKASFAYIISAAAGVLVIILIVLLVGKILTKKGD